MEQNYPIADSWPLITDYCRVRFCERRTDLPTSIVRRVAELIRKCGKGDEGVLPRAQNRDLEPADLVVRIERSGKRPILVLRWK